jgi:Ran GTPase-activating protein 1
LASLVDALLTLPNLHTVNLNDNAFGLNTQAPLVSFLSKHVPLKHLILNNNGLGPRAGVLVADALSELAARKKEARAAGKEAPDLETIICGRNRLENGSMAAWAKVYSLHTGVREVQMVQNGIRPEGIAVLLREGLKHCSEIRILDLQDNTFTLPGSQALIEVLPGWKHVQELGIGECLVSIRGGVLLGEFLAKGSNQTIETLRLQYNEIDALGLKGLAEATKNALPALRRIELNGNKFSEDDSSVETIRELLDARKEKAEGDAVNDEWGIDSLSDLEEESEDEEGESDEEEESEEKADRVLEEADQAEAEPVAQDSDKEVDDLAKQLGKTEL